MIKIVQENIDNLEKKDFTLFFYILDTKGNPSSALEYIYKTALTLNRMGYKVKMLHNENDFYGVGDWLGEEYAALPHAHIEKENVMIGASDFLFIPEIFLVGLQVNHPEFRYDYDTKAGKEEKLNAVYEIMDQYLTDGGDMFKLFEDMQNEMVNDSFLSSLLRKGKEAEKVEESASVQQN